MVLWDIQRRDWNPWREVDRMRRRMNRLLGDVSGTVLGGPFPAVNVRSDGSQAVATVELPGVRPEDIDINVENDLLTIRGSREPEPLAEGERFRRHERGHGSFVRDITLPFTVDAEKVQATYAGGILTITMPRTEASRPRKIEISG